MHVKLFLSEHILRQLLPMTRNITGSFDMKSGVNLGTNRSKRKVD